MKLIASAHTHPDSPLTGSTTERLIDKAVELGRTYFSYTDPAYMTNIYSAYLYAKSKGLGFIPGVEFFFKDPDCSLTASSKSAYFKITLYATNQDQFKALSHLSSKESQIKITSYEKEYSAIGWDDLEEAAKNGLIACTSDLHDMVAKHAITESEAIGEEVFKKLKSIFGDKLYVSVIGNENTKAWLGFAELFLEGGKKLVLPMSTLVKTNAAQNVKIKEIVENSQKHHKIFSYIDRYRLHEVNGKDGLSVVSAKEHWGFFPFPQGDLQHKANKYVVSLAKKYGTKIIYSDYAFYAEKDDKIVQDIRLYQEDIREHVKRHMHSTEEAVDFLKKHDLENEIEAIFNNTAEFASNFDKFSLSYSYRFPEIPGNRDPLEICMEIIKKTGRLPKDNPEYVSRLKYELSVLAGNGKVNLLPYFLPIRDVLDHYLENGRLVGPARGSAGGSLFMYLMGITHIDPIKYGLSFERFLSVDRVLNGDMPDVDVDLVDRKLLVGDDGFSGYMYNRWGDKAAQISTRTKLRLKSSIKDVNKYLSNGAVNEYIEKLTKALPAPPQGTEDESFVFGFEDDGSHIPGLIEVNSDLQKYAETNPKEWDYVRRCLGINRQNSKHASAFVIADVPIKSIVPVFFGGNVTQYEAKGVEKAKLIKYDFLIVKQLEDIEGCINRVNSKSGVKMKSGRFLHKGEELFIWDLPEDIDVYKSVWEGDTETIFQINTQSMVPFVKQIKPKSIIDLSTILALVRPGPLDFVDPDTGLTMADEYIERRNGRGTIKIPELAELLPETYGVMCYQEQTSKVAREIGKMKPTTAEELRRVFSKKLKAKALAMKPLFMEGAVKTVGEDKAEMIWQQMETSSRYSFNLSHSCAYALITYASMFLKHHYPLEWWASVLTNADEDEISTKLFKHVRDKVAPPDINISTNEMQINYQTGKILSKMTVMKGIGEKITQPIIDSAPYVDIKDFIQKGVAGPSLTRKLIHIGVMDSLFPPNASLIEKMQKYEDTVQLVAYEEKIKKGKNAKLKAGSVDPTYLTLHPLKDFQMKKAILPTIPISLSELVVNYPTIMNEGTKSRPMFSDSQGRPQVMLSGDELVELESKAPYVKNVYYCIPAYVVKADEFVFQKNTKKALKLFVDIDGRISERVMWPPWEGNEPIYPKELKKGSIVMLYMTLKADRTESRISQIKVLT